MDDPYGVLGLSADSDDEAIRRADTKPSNHIALAELWQARRDQRAQLVDSWRKITVPSCQT